MEEQEQHRQELNEFKTVASENVKSFHETATENNNVMRNVAHDIWSYFQTQKNSSDVVESSIDNLMQEMEITAEKINETNVLLHDSINIQNQMLSELGSIESSITNLTLQMPKWLKEYASGSGGAGIADYILGGAEGIALIKKLRGLATAAEGAEAAIVGEEAAAAGVATTLGEITVGGAALVTGLGEFAAGIAGIIALAGAAGLAGEYIKKKLGLDNPRMQSDPNAPTLDVPVPGVNDSIDTLNQRQTSGSNVSFASDAEKQKAQNMSQNQNQGQQSDVDRILQTIRTRESGTAEGNYTITNQSASGAYQFIPSTWQGLTKKYGVGQDYQIAGEAPKEIQDAVARKYIEDILKRNNGDVSAVPKEWYAGPKGFLTPNELAANRGLTVEKYQNMWMDTYNKTGGESQQQPQSSSGPPPVSGKVYSPTDAAPQTPGAAGAPTPGSAPAALPSGVPMPQSGMTGSNGYLPDSALESIGEGGHRLAHAAAAAYKQMVAAAAQDGIKWSVTDSYRPYAVQVKLAKEKGLYSQGGLAAAPGTSPHGWGVALDLGGGANSTGTKQNNWLQQNAGRFGFHTIPREPWHWQFGGGGGGAGTRGGAATSMGQTAANAGATGAGGGPAPGGGVPMGGMVGGMPIGGMFGGGMGGMPMPFGAHIGAKGMGILGAIGLGANLLQTLTTPRFSAPGPMPAPPPQQSMQSESTMPTPAPSGSPVPGPVDKDGKYARHDENAAPSPDFLAELNQWLRSHHIRLV